MSKEQEATINLGTAMLIAFGAVCAIGLATLLVVKTGQVDTTVMTPEVVAEREQKLADTRQEMAKERASYRVISKEKGTVQLPVDVAMRITLQELQDSRPRLSGVAVNPAMAVNPPVVEGTAEAEAAAGEQIELETEPVSAEEAQPEQVQASE